MLLAALLLPACFVRAQAASGAAAFLELDGGARGAAMGGAFTAVADDASAVFYNPAGPALASKSEAMISHSQWLEGLWNEHAAYVRPLSDKLTVFAGLSALLGPPLEKYSSLGDRTGSFSAADGAFGIGAAAELGPALYAGLNLKAVYAAADREKALAYAGDLGLIKNLGALRLGFSAQNLGTRLKLYKESFDLPVIVRAGAAYRLRETYWLSGEAVKTGDGKTFLAAGTEAEGLLTPDYTASIRLGYKQGRSKNTGPGFSAGAGLRNGDMAADYAFSPFGELGDTHRFTFSYRFGKSRAGAGREEAAPLQSQPQEPAAADSLEAADAYLEQKDYANAGKNYDLALRALPEGDPLRVYALERQGQLALAQEDLNGAKSLFLSSLRAAGELSLLNVSVVKAHLGLAYSHEKSGENQAAILNYEKALTLLKTEETRAAIKKTLERLKAGVAAGDRRGK